MNHMKSNDLISREEALCMLEFNKHNYYGCGSMKDIDKVMQDIKNLDAVDAEPVRHGRWIDHGDYITTAYGSLDLKICSICNCEVTLDGYDYYCANCGAKMDAEVQHGEE